VNWSIYRVFVTALAQQFPIHIARPVSRFGPDTYAMTTQKIASPDGDFAFSGQARSNVAGALGRLANNLGFEY
jgi:hypothetical protein